MNKIFEKLNLGNYPPEYNPKVHGTYDPAIWYGKPWWRWQHKYMFPRYAGMAPLFQLWLGMSFTFYVMNYGKITEHRFEKYHW